MRLYINLFLLLLIVGCKNQGQQQSDTILDGTANILVEKTILPIVEEQQQVFEAQYRGRLTLIPASESQILQAFNKDEARLAILPRKLTPQEETVFRNKKIIGKITPFATDAIVFFQARSVADTLLKEEQVYKIFKNENSSVKKLIFCNADLSMLDDLKMRAKVPVSTKSVLTFGVETESDLVKFLTENPGSVGVLPLNRVLSPSSEFAALLPQIRAMAVKSVNLADDLKNYFKPNQSNVGANLYPFSRTLYMLNYQGKAGLGMGFASFIAGDIGQRIVLKSGLLPVRIPPRIIATRKKIITTK